MQTKPSLENVPDPSQSDDPIGKSIKETVAKSAEWFLAIVGLTYACGFLIVFTFFKSFGINTIEFIEAKYIHIGSLFVIACITIILPMRWLFVVIKRWLDHEEGNNRKEVKNIIKLFLSGGALGNKNFWAVVPSKMFWKSNWPAIKGFFESKQNRKRVKHTLQELLKDLKFWQAFVKVIKWFLWSNWKASDKHGIHASFPAIGSGILMMWCFLLLLTFAKPDFTQTGQHPRLVFLNLLFPLTIIALAIPADWIKDRGRDFLYPAAEKCLRLGRFLIRFWWVVTGPLYFVLFFWKRFLFDADQNSLKWLIFCFFAPPIVTMVLCSFLLFFWRTTLWCLSFLPIGKLRTRLRFARRELLDAPERFRDKELLQRFTILNWILYPIQWALFLGQCWFFLRVIIRDNLGVSLREVFVGQDWHLLHFPLGIYQGLLRFVSNKPQDQNVFPNGGFIFIVFILLLVFFGFRFLYRIRQIKGNKSLTLISTFCLLGVLFYFSILSFARNIYPYIPAVKGGGDYTWSRPVQLAFDTNFISSIPPMIREKNQSTCLILLDANSSFVFLAVNSDAGGPKNWRSNTETNNRPTVYEIRREAIISITYSNSTTTNSDIGTNSPHSALRLKKMALSEEMLRSIPPSGFESWAVIALGGIQNKVQVGNIGVDGRIYPVFSSAMPRKKQEG